MTRSRTANFFSHLTLAFAGLALAVSEIDFIPEMIVLVLIYLVFLVLAYHLSSRWTLPGWSINMLGLLIAFVVSVWIAVRLGDAETSLWQQEVPFLVAVVPYFGPLLMALTIVRLFCPRGRSDFWVIQGLGLLQICLGCVLAAGSWFGWLLLAYLLSALCTLATQERQSQLHRSDLLLPTKSEAGVWNERLRWLGFSARWTVAVGLVALPLFLLTPRTDNPDWDPWSRFGFRQPDHVVARTGFSEEIDLTKSSSLEEDNSVAFTVHVTDFEGNPVRGLALDTRWRGIVLDRYDNGRWSSSLTWSRPALVSRGLMQHLDEAPDLLRFDFKVPGRAGGLFLAEPLRLGPTVDVLPVWTTNTNKGPARVHTLFYEDQGTISPLIPPSSLARGEYRYSQLVPRNPRERTRSDRNRGDYLQQIVRNHPLRMEAWTRDRLLLLTANVPRYQALHQAVRANIRTADPLPPQYWEPVARLLSDHLAYSGQYGYSMSYSPAGEDADPVLDFLLHVRSGPCERFATALTLMLRAVGIPARVVKGFRGLDEGNDGNYQIRNSYAHAWVEAMVLAEDTEELHFDWVSLDPTPENSFNPSRSDPLNRLWALQQSSQALWQELIVGYNPVKQADLWNELFASRRWILLAPWVGLGLVVLLGSMLWQRRRRAPTHQRGIAGLYQQLIDTLNDRLQLTARSDETPRELAQRAREVLCRRERVAILAELPEQVVELYYAARFGSRFPLQADLALLRTRLRQLDEGLQATG